MTVPHIENHNISRERVKNSVECGTVAKKVGDNLTQYLHLYASQSKPIISEKQKTSCQYCIIWDNTVFHS